MTIKLTSGQKANILMLGLVILLSTLYLDSCHKTKQVQRFAKAVDDTLQLTKNKYGQQVATISILQGSKSDLLKMNASKDTALQKLQEIVKKQRRLISATVLTTLTDNSGTSFTTVTENIDTIRKDSLIYLYPEYKTDFSDKWRKVNILANKDSVHWSVIDYNEFSIVQKNKRNGLFKASTAVVEVTNLNPYTTTAELRTFNIEQAPHKRGRFFLFGNITGAAAVLFISHLLISK